MKAPCIAAALLALAGAAHPFTAEVSHVTDGDTVWVREPGHRPFKLRLDGLDAPERCQAGGEAARAALAARLLHRPVEVSTRARDAHGRAIGRLWLEGADVGAWLVRQGLAWNVSYRGRAGLYAEEQAAARAARRGVFAEAAPEYPRDFRRRHGPCARP